MPRAQEPQKESRKQTDLFSSFEECTLLWVTKETGRGGVLRKVCIVYPQLLRGDPARPTLRLQQEELLKLALAP